jgi:soluble lytic murein transglycosylase-like protein
MELRKKHGVKQPVSVGNLQNFAGDKVLEVKGVVKGTFRSGATGSIILERPDGEPLLVDTDFIPDWLTSGDTPARLLVRAQRDSAAEPLQTKLIAMAPEADVAAKEPKPVQPPNRGKVALPSRSNGGGLYGPIGKRGSGGRPQRASTSWRLPASQVTPIYAGFIKSVNRRLTESQALEIATGIVGFSLKYNVDARLIMAMVMVESGFNPDATSRAGARGLGQLMPGTAQELGVSDSYSTIENLYGTVKLVRKNLTSYGQKTQDRFESLVLSIAAYNAGAGAVARHGGIPPYRETQNYVRKVVGLYFRFTGQA